MIGQKFTLLLLALSLPLLNVSADADQTELTSVHTTSGRKYFGPAMETATGVRIFDMRTATHVNVDRETIAKTINGISESQADGYVPFPCYVAWKSRTLLKGGRIEAPVVHMSEKGVFVGVSAQSGIEIGLQGKLLSAPIVIEDPVTGEVLGGIRDAVGDIEVVGIAGEKLIKIESSKSVADAPNLLDNPKCNARSIVEFNLKPKLLVIDFPEWKTFDNSELIEDANFLHKHLIAEFMRQGLGVVSRSKFNAVKQELAFVNGQDSEAVDPMEIASKCGADVLVSCTLLPKGNFCSIQADLTELETGQLLATFSGNVDRAKQKVDSARAELFVRSKRWALATPGADARVVLPLLAQATSVTFDTAGNVTHLCWRDKPISMQQLAAISKFQNIQWLEFTGFPFTDKHLAQLGELKKLRLLKFWNTSLSAKSVDIIARSFPKMDYVCFVGVPWMDVNAARKLSEIKTLKFLELDWTGLDDDCLEVLSELPTLELIMISGCKGVTDKGLKHLHKHSGSIKYLYMKGTSATEEGVNELRRVIPNAYVESNF